MCRSHWNLNPNTLYPPWWPSPTKGLFQLTRRPLLKRAVLSSSEDTTENLVIFRWETNFFVTAAVLSVVSTDDDETKGAESSQKALYWGGLARRKEQGNRRDQLQAFQMQGRVFWLEKDIKEKFWSPWKNIYLWDLIIITIYSLDLMSLIRSPQEVISSLHWHLSPSIQIPVRCPVAMQPRWHTFSPPKLHLIPLLSSEHSQLNSPESTTQAHFPSL